MSQFPPGPPPNIPPGGQQPPGPPQQPPGPPGQPPGQPGWGAPPPGPAPQPGYPPQQPPGPPGQPPGQPGWGQQPYPPATPPSGGGGGGGLKILIGVAVVAVVAIGAFLVLGGSDSGSSPEDALNDFFAAAQDGDCAGMMDLITTSSFAGADLDQVRSECEASIEAGDNIFSPGDSIDSIETKSEEGNTAVLTVATTTDGEQTTDEITLRKEDGDWKIDFSEIGSSDDSGGGGSGSSDGSGDSGDLPTDDSVEVPDVSIPEDLDLPDDIPPECDFSSSDYDPDACLDAMGG
ncbi:MAG TPA: DUF4878 domain-containing protein [Acidimicrobiales bacterium]|nr:DUF4878 domain-containing protein [Acidimicrobiales bacterium]